MVRAWKVWLTNAILPIVFIAYAVGGQPLVRKYLPFLAEKDKTTEADESDKK